MPGKSCCSCRYTGSASVAVTSTKRVDSGAAERNGATYTWTKVNNQSQVGQHFRSCLDLNP